MKNNKIVIPLLGVLLMSTGCNSSGGEKSVSYIENENLLVYFDMNSTANNKADEKVSNKQYDLKYVFKEAKYKQNSEVPCVEGVIDKAIDFDGNSVSFEAGPISFGQRDFTFSMFIAPRAYERNDGKYTSIFSNFNGSAGLEISMAQYGYWKVSVGTSKGVFNSIMSDENTIIPLYDWSHIAIRYSVSNSNCKIFLNGNLVDTLSLREGVIAESQENIIVGKSRDCMTESVFQLNHFNGLMDEIKIYDGALSDQKIQEFANVAKNTQRSSGITLSYETLADDRYAPQYHMRNPRAWANEFYGAFQYNGKYHVFSQHNPFRAYYQNGQRWGHLVSNDLVHWKSLTPALTPSDNHIDNSQTFSGSCILDKNGKPVMFYTGVNEANQYFNSISYATPKDLNDPNLETWVKSNQKIINQGSISNQYEFRDPFIYKEDGQYFMLIGGNNSPVNGGNGAIFIYKATNDELTSWSYMGVCYSGSTNDYPEQLGSTYELPNLFKLQNKNKTITKYMLMCSPIYGRCNSVTYWVGSFDKNTGKFTPDNPKPSRYDLGPESMVLAASGFYDEKTDRNIFTTMMRTGMSDADSYLAGWNDAQTLWKEIYLNDSGEARFTPIEEYSSLEDEQIVNLETANLTISQANSILSIFHSDSYKIEVEFDPNGDSQVGAYVKYGEAHGEQILSSYDYSTNTLYSDTSRSSLLLKNLKSGGGIQEITGNATFIIYVDRSVVETYLNDVNEIATLAWNKYQEANGIKLYSSSGKAIIKKLKVTTLKCAYDYQAPAYWEE